jgi:hypothetical protein
MIKNILIYLKKEYTLILLYFSAFVINILFLVLAYHLGFQLIEKYILALSASSILSTLFYSLVIKSQKRQKIINLEIERKGIKFFLIIFLILLTYIYINNYLLLSIFFLTLVFSEFILNLALTKYQIDTKNYHHAYIRNLQSLVKFFSLALLFYSNNIIIIGIINNIIIMILFGSILINYNFKVNKKKSSFGIDDILYTLTGSIIFQLDKIIGPLYLDANIITKYFINFKIASVYQIMGSICSQPIRNLLIKTKNINKEMKKNIKNVSFLLIFFYIFSNFILIIIYKHNLLNFLNTKIEFNDIIIYNLISLSFILHTHSGFYIDKLYLNNKSQYLIRLNIICIIIIGSTIYLINNPVAWALSILISQILLIIFSQKIISIFK